MKRCLACGAVGLEPLVDLGTAPALTGMLCEDAVGARSVPRGRLDLHLCRRCGHVANAAFDPALVDYDESYDNSLHHSPTFRRFADELAERLVHDRGIRNSHVVEIGSGKGDFLSSICSRGGNRGTGYDPTVDPALDVPDVTFVADYFRPGADLEPYDLLVCRHVLEHLHDPGAMLAAVREAVPGPETLFYLEVPSAEFNFGPDGMWDCIYPHVSYFSAQSLEALVRRCGFEVVAAGTAFGGQFLWVEARPGGVDTATPTGQEEHLGRVEEFGSRWQRTTTSWRKAIEDRADADEEVVVWGAGAKGVTFLNAVDALGRVSVVDLNPNKWGRFLPGTGHRVDDPRSLADRPVRTVLITNPAYRREISDHLQDIGVHADVVSV